MSVVAVVGLDQVVENLLLILSHLMIWFVGSGYVGLVGSSEVIFLVVRHDRQRTVMYLWYDWLNTIEGCRVS